MSRQNSIDETADACCCKPVFIRNAPSSLMKDPRACCEGDTDACATEAAGNADACGRCCC